MPRGAPKGTRPPNAGKGRKAGVPNKVTQSVKDAIREAFELRGGVTAFLEWSHKNPDEFYRLWGRMMPAEVDVTSKGESLAPAHREAEIEEARRRAALKLA